VPAISLVVCTYREYNLLERLLGESNGLFDDLIVVHDGPESVSDGLVDSLSLTVQPPAIDYFELTVDSPPPQGYRISAETPNPGTIHELVTRYGGRYFEGPRCFQQEPHWPFAWSQAKYDWILRLDADEFPSEGLKTWLHRFREKQQLPQEISGYTCIWPLWNGRRVVTPHWPTGRNFLFNRRQVHFFGMVEQVPIPDGRWESLDLQLCHQPMRKSYGLANILWRKQGYHWRRVISESLLGSPRELTRWRWNHEEWPPFWKKLRERPICAGLYFFLYGLASTLRDQWRTNRSFMPFMAMATPLHHLLIGLQLYRKKNARLSP